MVKYCKKYIDTYYLHFKFFRPECKDKRIREVMMRQRLCMPCPGLDRCRMHPEFWLEGEDDRIKENNRFIEEFGKEEELPLLPDDITEDLGAIEIKREIIEIETRLGV